MSENIESMINDLTVSGFVKTQENPTKFPKLNIEYTYFTSENTDIILNLLKIKDKRCIYCQDNINYKNLRVIIQKEGEWKLVCKKISCCWKSVWSVD